LVRTIQAIANTANGDEVAGGGGLRFEFGAEGGDEIIDGAEAGISLVAPDDIEELLAADGFARTDGEQSKHPDFFVGERMFLAGTGEDATAEVDGGIADFNEIGTACSRS
jgi:hypothetical protein